MSEYRKKPVVIEAFQFDGDFMKRDGTYYVPHWATEAWKNDILYFESADLYIKTLEGNMKVNVGDYVIQGVKGELYPCKSDIFEATYEVVEGDSNE